MESDRKPRDSGESPQRRRRHHVLPAVTAMAWPALARDSSSAATKPKPTCTPNGTVLSISARNDTFEGDCLAAPAKTQFEIAFNNEDHDIHNVSIYDKDHGDRALFKGEVVYGPKAITYSVPAQPEGTYQFRCDPHGDSMLGTFVVGSGRSTAPSSTTTTTRLLNPA